MRDFLTACVRQSNQKRNRYRRVSKCIHMVFLYTTLPRDENERDKCLDHESCNQVDTTIRIIAKCLPCREGCQHFKQSRKWCLRHWEYAEIWRWEWFVVVMMAQRQPEGVENVPIYSIQRNQEAFGIYRLCIELKTFGHARNNTLCLFLKRYAYRCIFGCGLVGWDESLLRHTMQARWPFNKAWNVIAL